MTYRTLLLIIKKIGKSLNNLQFKLFVIRARFTKPTKKFVILIASYNNQDFFKKNLDSVFDQTYSKYRVIYINDCSTDNTQKLVSDYVKYKKKTDDFLIITNDKRKGSLENKYYAIHNHCEPEEIIVSLDGDDSFASPNVLEYLNFVYSNPKIWMTFGQYRHTSGKESGQRKYSRKVKKENSFRKTYHPSHLRTYYTWLYKKIDKFNFLNSDGDFFLTCEDRATMYPMVELAANHHVFIKHVLYNYNDQNPIGLYCNNKKDIYNIKKKNRSEIISKPALKPLI